MRNARWWMTLLTAAGLGMTSGAFAKATAEEAAKLGKDLTAVGAQRAGNSDGSIPEWVGGKYFDDTIRKQTPATLEALRQQFEDVRKKSPADFDALLKYLDSFEIKDYPAVDKQVDAIIAKLPASEQALAHKQREQIGGGGQYEAPQFIITKDNLAEHADKLTEGHKAMFAKYPSYRMIVYPTLRTAYFPAEVEQATIKNASSAELIGTDEIKDAVLGFPFPIPKSGAEVLWNHKMRFRGSAVRRFNNQAIVKLDGSFKISKLVEDVKFKYANLEEPAPGTKILLYYLSEVLSPPRVAGQLTLVHETSGAGGSGRDAWIYNPGLGRVNRAPDVGYDNPYIGTDGEQFNDQVDMFNGALDRYDWKLIGKQEKYIAYNSFLINAPLIKYADIIRPGHINQNLSRYELHRVWIVEATLRDGLRHQFKKRRFYIDEDSWAVAVVDCYDNRDQLWKVQEAQLLTVPFVPTVTGIPEIIYDLQSGRYFVTALQNEDRISDFKIDYADKDFAPNGLSRRAQSR
ncbi:DUF1329 domain-containing protein [Sinimarinibacterium flocculans]|uniref:Uncharacterized protein DUF1329 n=2 Tax=Sinimarinibacterium flocculans TaxID=985250 RepID=A0A318EBU5_9GAMM|nr:DUF1329 domain-containing protein [Sinimarinibacterium flocculans]PXV67215.1 uncharacterized protein DUF1329 [Sinimarinibacterium flocculans]